ncbi:MAG: hypothetical protein AAF533_18345 [Acidobacteriota bacterium]
MKLDSRSRLALTLLLGLALGWPGRSLAQGLASYYNVESPQVHPIEVVTTDDSDNRYLLTCNTPDNMVEVYDTSREDTAGTLGAPVLRIRVGLEPVSVRWVDTLQTFFVANFLGDSITAVALDEGPRGLEPELLGTFPVADEPLDLTLGVVAGRPTLFVTHLTIDRISLFDPVALTALNDGTPALVDLDGDTTPDEALKQPWTSAVGPAACADRLFVLGHLGGNRPAYDFDLYSQDLAGGNTDKLGGLGAINWNMTFNDNGDLFVVGSAASNRTVSGVSALSVQPTGFVQTMLYVVRGACDFDSATITPIDLNLDGVSPAAKSDALATATDVLVVGNQIWVTAFSSDRVGVVQVSPFAPQFWPKHRVDIPLLPGAEYARSGPRGLAFKPTHASSTGSVTPARVYVANRLSQSVAILDPSVLPPTLIGQFELPSDSTPVHVREGRKFLYSAELSGNGFVSCSSCHPDGRTDGMAWDVSDGVTTNIPFDLNSLFGTNNLQTTQPGEKGIMVTQSLQGLLNFEAPLGEGASLVSNGPFYWRGTRHAGGDACEHSDFGAFNSAFVELLGAPDVCPDPIETAGLTDTEIDLYEEFVNSIHYPPNPRQPPDRRFSGSFGSDPDDVDDGEGALRGMKVFHLMDSIPGNGLSCVHCHSLPEGSNNLITETRSAIDRDGVATSEINSLETAALRGLFQKEAMLDLFPDIDGNLEVRSGDEGLAHAGSEADIHEFVEDAFSSPLCAPASAPCGNTNDVVRFIEEMDFGTGPAVGRSLTLTFANKGSQSVDAELDLLEQQAREANAGLVITAGAFGYWLDPSTCQLDAMGAIDPDSCRYRSEPTVGSFTRAAILATLDPGERFIVQATPLGRERHVAHRQAQPVQQTGPDPSELLLEPMITNTAHRHVPEMQALWDEPGLTDEQGGPRAHTIRVYQNALANDLVDDFGACSVRHEAPRRLRVSGKDIRHGARLRLRIAQEHYPIPWLPPEQQVEEELLTLTLPLYPTDDKSDGGNPVWETAVELEPDVYLRIMTGREFNGLLPAIADLDSFIPTDPSSLPVIDEALAASHFIPGAGNHVHVEVLNDDVGVAGIHPPPQPGVGGWQRLRIEETPELCP